MGAISIIGLILAIGAFIGLIIRVKKLAKAVSLEIINFKIERRLIFSLIGLSSIGLALFFVFMPAILNNAEFFNWSNITGSEYFCSAFGGFLMGVTFDLWYVCFRLYYYQKLFSKKLLKLMHLGIYVLIPAFVLSLFLCSEGHAQHFIYPLINGISFNGGVHFTTAAKKENGIAWYALCIIAGAVICYFIADHLMYKKFGKHSLLESTFYVAFPAGIIGARIFYVIGNWEREFANQPFWKVFAIWEGGLTILGGAVFGIIAGVLWFKWRHPKTNIFDTVDIAVGSILFAQAIGRLGNFFNCEVHGGQVPTEYWMWIPTMFRNQMTYSSATGASSSGMIYAPLFFIEMLTNLAGFVFLDYFVLRKLIKVRKSGDCFGLYMIWYGFTRVFMEPLRASSFNMGVDGKWSWIWAIIFVDIGILFIVGNHFIRYLIDKKKNNLSSSSLKHNSISLIVLATLSCVFMALGLVMLLTTTVPEGSAIQYCPHNIGLILTIIGISLVISCAWPIFKLIDLKQNAKA